jgi:LPXTG-motif cell wall-anchored protein
MPAKAVTVTATYKDAPVTTYAVTVNSGTGSGDFAEGATVNITANEPATGKVFDKWTTSDGVEFANANTATTTFVMPAKAVTVTATYKDISSETPDYKIIAGENGIWKKGNTKGIVIISNGDYGDFTGVNVDDIFIDPSNYTSAAGSTVVTLKPAYLETLAVGTHIVTLQFGNYSVQTNLTILAADERPDESKPDESKPDESKPNEEIPKTGDSNHTLPLIGLLLLSGSALIGVTRNKKKKKSYNK